MMMSLVFLTEAMKLFSKACGEVLSLPEQQVLLDDIITVM